MGRDLQQHKGFSNESTRLIDKEVLRILSESYERAMGILKKKRVVLEEVTARLIEQENIDGELVMQCLKKKAPEPAK